MQAKARVWPCMPCIGHIRSTADRIEAGGEKSENIRSEFMFYKSVVRDVRGGEVLEPSATDAFDP